MTNLQYRSLHQAAGSPRQPSDSTKASVLRLDPKSLPPLPPPKIKGMTRKMALKIPKMKLCGFLLQNSQSIGVKCQMLDSPHLVHPLVESDITRAKTLRSLLALPVMSEGGERPQDYRTVFWFHPGQCMHPKPPLNLSPKKIHGNDFVGWTRI